MKRFNNKRYAAQALILLAVLPFSCSPSGSSDSPESESTSAEAARPEQDYLSYDYARYIHENPGSYHDISEADAREQAREVHMEAFILYQNGQTEQARQKYEQALAFFADGQMYYNYANSLTRLDHYENAIQAYDIAMQLPDLSTQAFVHYNLGGVYSLQGNLTQSRNSIIEAVDHGYNNIAYIMVDPDLENLRNSPDWPDFLEMLEERIALVESGERAPEEVAEIDETSPEEGETATEIRVDSDDRETVVMQIWQTGLNIVTAETADRRICLRGMLCLQSMLIREYLNFLEEMGLSNENP